MNEGGRIRLSNTMIELFLFARSELPETPHASHFHLIFAFVVFVGKLGEYTLTKGRAAYELKATHECVPFCPHGELLQIRIIVVLGKVFVVGERWCLISATIIPTHDLV